MKIIDSHTHLYDNTKISHQHLNETNPLFENLLGDYSSLPKTFLWQDYQRCAKDFIVDGIVWHEFVSDTPALEIEWANDYLDTLSVQSSMVAKINFADDQFDTDLDFLKQFPRVTSVRQHMAYHPSDPNKRFADDIYFSDPTWHKNISRLNNTDLTCSLEVFSNQLPNLIHLIKQHPHIKFTIAVLGWPHTLSKVCFTHWTQSLKELALLDNFNIQVVALECVFGMNWNVDLAKPWIHTLFETIGIERCFFGSHSPIAALAMPFDQLVGAHLDFLSGCSDSEKHAYFYENANQWFRVGA